MDDEFTALGEPVAENGDLCIFATDDTYDIYKRETGKVDSIPMERVAALGQIFWEALSSSGWRPVVL